MPDYVTRRRMMVDHQVRPSDVTSLPILEAMLNVPREVYVPEALHEFAYLGENLVIAPGRVLIEPRTFAKMLFALDLRAADVVLDIGCGMGYSTAVVARLAGSVVGLEAIEVLAAHGEAVLARQAVENAAMVCAPLTEGAPGHGPYDAVMIQGGVEVVPPAIFDQLRDGGRIACLFMEGAVGTCRIGYKTAYGVTWRDAFNASAPVLPGFARAPVFSF